MSVGTAVAVYFVIWWITLFVTLPFGMRSQAEAGRIDEGTDPGAPVRPELGRRMFYNTIVAALIFALFLFVTVYLDIGVDDLPELVPARPVAAG